MKGKRIAKVGDLVLLDSRRYKAPYIALKTEDGYDIGGFYNFHIPPQLVWCNEVTILEKNFQETAPERITKEVKEMLGVKSVTATTITVNNTEGIAPGDELVINSLSTENNSMNWKEWCLWSFIIICAIIAFYRWGYVK